MFIKINSLEMRNVLNLDATKRYRYFINKVTDSGKIWGLYNNGWALAGDNIRQFIPLWPLNPYAKLCATNCWENYKPKSISIHNFIDNYIDELKENSIFISIFYIPDNKAVITEYDQLKYDLIEELRRIE